MKPIICTALVMTACGASPPPQAVPPPVAVPAAPAPPAVASGEPPYMASAPRLGETRGFSPAAPATWKLANGMSVVLVEKHDAPLVSMVVVVRAGSDADPAGKSGLASLTADLLDEGAGKRDASAIAEEVERLGGELTTAAGQDDSRVELSAGSPRFPEAAALLADVVRHPRLAGKDFDRVRAETMGRLAQRRVEPRILATVATMTALYGDSPYGRPVTGFESTVSKLGVVDARRFYGRFYRPNDATLIVVGDVTADALRSQVDTLFGDWKAEPIPELPVATPVASPPRVVLIDKPGAAQSSLRIVFPGIARSDPSYAALEIVTSVFGGSFTSRLDRNLRERNNYSYGAFANLFWPRGRGLMIATSEVFAATTAPAIREALRELGGGGGDITAEELDKAKAIGRHQLVSTMELGGTVARLLAELVAWGLPVDTITALDADIARVQPDDVKAAMSAHIRPESATIVVVGDLAKIRPEIEKLGLGAILVMDADGKPIR